MKAKANLQLLKTTSFDSGALGPLGMVAHQFPAAGHYRAVVLRLGRAAADISFVIDEKSDVMQLDVDLAQAARNSKIRAKDCDCSDNLAIGTVSPKGYVLFHASSGSGYAVTAADAGGKTVFDSTNLGQSDLFAVSLLEPAVYAMTNKLGAARGEIIVSLTPDAAKQLKTLETRYIDASKQGFNPARTEITSSQGLVFRVKDAARIVIEKTRSQSSEPDKPVIRWQSLQPARNTKTVKPNPQPVKKNKG